MQTNYFPTVEQIFSDSSLKNLNAARGELNQLNAKLTRIVKSGNSDEAVSAGRAIRAVQITLLALQELEAAHQARA